MLKPDLATLPCADMLGAALPHPDGERGSYAFGINAWQRDGRWMLSHSGALRGWRMVHMRFPQDDTSIVVMLNRTENPMPHALKIAECIGIKTTWDDITEQAAPAGNVIAGSYFSERLGLLAEIRSEDDKVTIDLGGESVPLVWTSDNTLANSSGFYRLEVRDERIHIHARQFGWRDTFSRLPARDDRALLAGKTFHCDTLKSSLIFSSDGANLRTIGSCGESDDYPVRALAAGFLGFDCTRALDETPPGRFTIRIRDADKVIEVGCFMARGFFYTVA